MIKKETNRPFTMIFARIFPRSFCGIMSFMLIAVSLFISSCGFHLRGTVTLPAHLTQNAIFVDGSDENLVDALIALLKANKVVISEKRENAVAILLSNVTFDQQVKTTDEAGLATGYQLSYEVEYSVNDTKGGALKPATRVIQQRNLEYSTDQELQFEEERGFLKDDMRKQVVLQIMRQLSS